VCDSIGIISRGRLVAEADQAELLSRYAVPAFELEAEDGCAQPMQVWASTLRRLPWVGSVTVDNAVARVTVADVERARRELLPSALQAGLIVRRYDTVRPSLEDVFLRLVGQGEVNR
jgi:ABC-2 type transport system ATP-binding protein